MLWNNWKQVPKVNKFWTRRQWPHHFLRDFPPRKTRVAQIHRSISRQENITYSSPTGQRVYRLAYADVTTKISWMDSLPNYLRYGAPLERAKNSATIPSLFEGLDHVASLFYEYSTTNKKELEVQTHHTQWLLCFFCALAGSYQLVFPVAWCGKYNHRYRFH